MQSEQKSNIRFFNCQIVKVVDGDTVDCIIDLGFHIVCSQRIRLANIDAPEIKEGELGTVAKKYMEQFLNKNMILMSEKLDKHRRFLGTFYEPGRMDKSINQQMIESGLAKEWR